MLGLKRGVVKLAPHNDAWEIEAQRTVEELLGLLGGIAVDAQHVGSTAIPSIHAKPIIDVAVGVRDVLDTKRYVELLEKNGFVFRGEETPNHLLFVNGDFEKDTRTHHIHVVRWNGEEWNKYINFRDYLRAFPKKAKQYEQLKQRLAGRFPSDREKYTEGKEQLIEELLKEARVWRAKR